MSRTTRPLCRRVREPGLGGPVGDLLARKRDGDELAVGPRIPVINEFLDGEIARLNGAAALGEQNDAPHVELLDALFRSTLDEVWADG
jgi:hypothetical protein